jgi:hypothetical protein
LPYRRRLAYWYLAVLVGETIGEQSANEQLKGVRSTAIAKPCKKRIKATPAIFNKSGCIQPLFAL